MLKNKKTGRFIRGFAWVMLIGSFPAWFGLFAAPFLPLTVAQQVLAAAIFAISGEVMFWVGAAILGGSVIARFRKPNVRKGRSFTGKNIAVLGATGGLGSAIVEALLREKAQVLAIGRKQNHLDSLYAGQANVRTVIADINSESSLESIGHAPDLDALIVAVGADVRKALAAHTIDDIQLQLSTNLSGAILACKVFAKRLRDGGTIVLLGGFGDGSLALPYYSVDVATRAGVSAFAQAMNREFRLEGRDIRVCYACPAPADTAAERPFGELWRSMGTPLVPVQKVANFILVTTLQRKAQAIMGWQNKVITVLNRISPSLADVLGLKAAGLQLRKAFGNHNQNKEIA